MAKKQRDRKGKVRECWKDNALVVLKTVFLECTDGCCPCHQQLLMTESRVGNFVSNASNRDLHCACLLIKRHGRAKIKVIKNNLERVLPSIKNISKNSVLQTRVRCMRSLHIILKTNFFKQFKEKVGTSNVVTFDVDAETFDDEACKVSSDICLC